MQLNTILSLNSTKSAVQCSSKKRALELISEIAAPHLKQNSQTLFESLLNREKLGSTGIGNGVAMPHGRIDDNEQAIAVLIQSQEPIEFDSVDNCPVNIILGLFVPNNQCKKYLELLSKLSEDLKDKHLLRQLRQAEDDQELYNIVSSYDINIER